MAGTLYTGTGGCVYSATGGAQGGFYKFSPSLPGPGRILLNGGDIDQGDIVSPAVTLTGDKILYVFGTDWGKSTVTGVVLLGDATEGGTYLTQLISWFQSNRASNKTSPCQLSVPGNKAFNVFVHRLIIGQPVPEINVQPYNLQILMGDD